MDPDSNKVLATVKEGGTSPKQKRALKAKPKARKRETQPRDIEPTPRVKGESVIPALGSKTEICLMQDKKLLGAVNLTTGELSIRTRANMLDAPRVNPNIKKSKQHTLPLSMSHGEGFTLPYGITIVTGPTAGGKSRFIRALNGIKRYMAVEPHDSNEDLENIYIFEEFDHALLTAFRDSLTSTSLAALDSIRAPQFEINGPAGPKGVIMPFFTMVTRASISLAKHGVSMLITVNPLHGDPEYVAAFNDMLASGVPGLIRLNPINANSTHFTGVVSDRLVRKGVDFSFPIPAKGGTSGDVTWEEVQFIAPPAQPQVESLSGIQINQLQETL